MQQEDTYVLGRRYPDRLFVGGLPPMTSAEELAIFFGNFANVIETKVIYDDNGFSKGYGFVTFKTKHDVDTVRRMGTLFLHNKKLNLGPAVRKETAQTEVPEVVVVPTVSKGAFYYPYAAQDPYVAQDPYAAQYPQPHMTYMPMAAPPSVAAPPSPICATDQFIYSVVGDQVIWWYASPPPSPPPVSPLPVHHQQPPKEIKNKEMQRRPRKHQVPPRFRKEKSRSH